MIVDCHTRIWDGAAQSGKVAGASVDARGPKPLRPATAVELCSSASCADKTLVLGFCGGDGEAIPNDIVADCVNHNGAKMIGIAGVDPTMPDAVSAAARLLDQTAFRGLTVSPAAQRFHPADSRAMKLYELAARRKAPVFFQQDSNCGPGGAMMQARPSLLDEIAAEYPEMTIVVSGMGSPWVEECISLIGRHSRVFADIAGLVRRPWHAYNALVLAHQYEVTDKLLFGSDFPFSTAAEAVEGIYRLHELTQGTSLPSVPREVLRTIVERDALTALGIARPGEVLPPQKQDDEEEQ